MRDWYGISVHSEEDGPRFKIGQVVYTNFFGKRDSFRVLRSEFLNDMWMYEVTEFEDHRKGFRLWESELLQ